MIDQTLINNNIAHCTQQLSQRSITNISNLYQINNFFTKELVEKTLDYVKISDKFHQVELQEYLNRTSITWDPDTVVEEIHNVLEKLTNDLNVLFDQNRKFCGLQIWKDTAGYLIGKHVDNSRVGYSLQIYLTTDIDNLGTYFYDNDCVVEIPYKQNAGYVTDAAQNIVHGMVRAVPPGHTRLSIYGTWS